MTARRLAARSVPGRARSWRPSAAVALAAFLAVGLAWSVVSLRQEADRHWQRASTLSATQTLAGAEVAAAWHCAAAGPCPGDIDAAARALDSQVRALVKDGVGGVSRPLTAQQAAVASARRGFASPRAAERADAAAKVAAAEPDLVKAIDAAATHQRALEHSADRVADLESLLLLVFAAVIVGLVVLRFTAIRVEGEENAATERARGEARFRSLVTNASDVVTLTGPDGVILFQTPSVRRVLGYEPEAGMGSVALDWCHPDDQDLARAAFVRTLAGEEYVTTVLRWRHADGTWRWLESVRTNLLADPDVAAVVINSRDVTEQRELAGLLAHNALHDVLTGLPNRALLVDRLDQAIRRGRCPAVLFVDLDDFKAVNDRLGHAVGDSVLKEMAARLASGAGPNDTVARLGADDFAVLLENVSSSEEAAASGERILSTLRAPMVMGGETVVPQASIGVAFANGSEGMGADELLSRADLAVSAAKGQGKGRVILYDREMRVALMGALDTKARLSRALRRGELELYYQPVVDLADGGVVAVEALLRWNDPTRGVVPPEDFIPLIEQTPMIQQLGSFALTTSCLQLAAWRRSGVAGSELKVSVNVAARQLEEPFFVDEVAQALRESGLAADSLTLEVTEGQIVRDVEASVTTLLNLRALGVRVAIDDFGTGYSSLSYLERLPVNMLKIDRAFVSGGPVPGEHADGSVLLRSIIDLGLALRLQVVAEGVETEEQRYALRAMGCPYGQGYLFSPPMSAEHVLPMLNRRLVAETA